jgi:anthranilate phosphoribosyltransferase
VIQQSLARLLDGHDLSREEARGTMAVIMAGDATQVQIAGFLVALRAKGETADEIAGCAEAMREHVLRVSPTRTDLVDVVGTGGDGANTYNISTAAALVAAAAGAAVAKHGNRAASSQTGAADVLEALGFELELPPERIERSIDELGFGFLFAQAHHPAMRHAAPVRRELATRTVFNVLGRLTNPAGARALVLGVYSPELATDARGCARAARRDPCLCRARRRRNRRVVAVRAEPRLRGGGRERDRVRARSARARNRAVQPRRAARRRRRRRGGSAQRSAARTEATAPP